jgi:hypothetical protein
MPAYQCRVPSAAANFTPSPPAFSAGLSTPSISFVVVFLYDTLAHQFGVDKSRIIFTTTATLAMRPIGADRLRVARRPLRTANPADDQRDFLLGDRAALRLFAQFHFFSGDARAVRHRHGRRVGRGRVAGHGGGAQALARRALGHFAERLLGGLLPGGLGVVAGLAHARMAVDVLAGRHSGVADAVHPLQRAGVGGLAAASRAEHRRGDAHCRPRMEAAGLPGAAHGVHDVPIARHAGPLSRIFCAPRTTRGPPPWPP